MMMCLRLAVVMLVACAILGGSSSLLLAQVVLPDITGPYRIAFVTAGTMNATGSAIATYNQFVTSVAPMLPPSLGTVMWTAIASTNLVNARDNTQTDPNNPSYLSVPIYNTLGQLVATGNAKLWGTLSVTSPLVKPINGDEYGKIINAFVWTGTSSGGHNPSRYNGLLGSGLGQLPYPVLGQSYALNYYWITATLGVPNVPSSLYGISSIINQTTP